MEGKTSYTHRLTHTGTHTHKPHNFLVARFAGGPRTTQSKLSWKEYHDNAERMDTKEGEGGGRDENRSQNLWFLHSHICRLREGEDGLFVSQLKSEGGCLMQYNKVAHLSTS